MNTLFNKDGDGSRELVSVLGLIDADLNFDKWEPILPLGLRELSGIIGSDVTSAICQLYHSGAVEPADAIECVRLAQQAAAMFTWLRVIPTLEAQHGNSGRNKRLGENEQGLTATQEFKDEDNIRNMAYEAVDALVALLDAYAPGFWTASAKRKGLNRLLIRSKEAFDDYYHIGSHRLFLTLIPMIREVQQAHIIPIITTGRYESLLAGDEEVESAIGDAVRRPLALLTMKKAVERLPVEVLPNGVVQVQQSATVRDKLRAEKSARESVAASLEQDAQSQLQHLADLIALMDEPPAELYVPGVTVQSKGITF